jgi:uracil-DNA glycosylase family 4
MVATVRCAPPDNRPTAEERDTCAPWLHEELAMTAPWMQVAVCLGSYAWSAAVRALPTIGYAVPRPQPRFGHAAEVVVSGSSHDLLVLGSYHPSQQNTFTGKLTGPMLDAVFARANEWSQAQSPSL